MSKRRITKASKRRLTLFGTISVIAIIYFFISLISCSYSIHKLSIEKNNLEIKYVELEEEAEKLKIDIEKLNDPEYLADFAREEYLYSKPDEYILQIDEITDTKDKIDSISITINKNYMLMISIILLILIFVYILFKGKKNINKKTKK